jgi:hypothetical protein
VAEWFSIEVLNGAGSARQWVDGVGDELVHAGLNAGATDWEWHHHSWGSVFEIEFADETAFEHFRNLPVVTAALDRVPDSVNGLLVHRGRGGSSGSRRPRRPRPIEGSGAASLPVPEEASRESVLERATAAVFLGEASNEPLLQPA